MKKKSKKYKVIRKCIYLCLYAAIIGTFIFLSNKYESLSEDKTIKFNNYYKKIETDKYDIVKANGLLKLLKNGKNIIFIGNHTSRWSKAYAYILTECLEEQDVKAYYYDLNADKTQKNSKYYEIRERLKYYLVSTDDSDNNLLAPSFYIVNDGRVEYYNVATTAMKNNIQVEDYWNNYTKESFKREIKNSIKRYYLNNR